MRRADLEGTILYALQHRLMDERLTKIFCEEYARAMNRLHGQRSAQREGDASRLSKIDQELDRLVRAIMDGVPASRVKEKMAELEAEKEKLEATLSHEPEDKIRIHPNMASYYREKIAALRPALTNEERRPQAVEIIRQLVDRVTLTPDTAGKKLEIALEGHIAGILSLATNAKAPLDENDACVQVTKLVAGVGFEPTTFRL
jgi:site-specific DNA recombinase